MSMTREAEMALLAAGSYWDIRGYEGYDSEKRDESNHAPIPKGWQLLPEHESHSGEGLSWSSAGFSARAYQRIGTNEIVISYAGTETSHEGFAGLNTGSAWDFIRGNFPLAVGAYGKQAYLAAEFYQSIKEKHGGNIQFTGHSLGGGLASLMAVWFDRPAYVYAQIK